MVTKLFWVLKFNVSFHLWGKSIRFLYFQVVNCTTYRHPEDFNYFFPQRWKKTKFNSQILAFRVHFFFSGRKILSTYLRKKFPEKVKPDLPTCNPARVVQNDVPLRKINRLLWHEGTNNRMLPQNYSRSLIFWNHWKNLVHQKNFRWLTKKVPEFTNFMKSLGGNWICREHP